MEISILYSKDKVGDVQAAAFVKQAVKNLGISAEITEQQTGMSAPQVLVNGFNLLNNTDAGKKRSEYSYEAIEEALERSAWTG